MTAALGALLAMAMAAFVAATIIPAQSEAVFVGFLATKAADPLALFIVASIANTAGSVLNWWIGRLVADGGLARLPQRLRPEQASLDKAVALFARMGWPSLLLSWVPIIGDPLTLAAGLLRYPLGRFMLIVGFAKAARYGALWAGWVAAS
jgi:membrane protein YqaA with SNARE-associated domain